MESESIDSKETKKFILCHFLDDITISYLVTPLLSIRKRQGMISALAGPTITKTCQTSERFGDRQPAAPPKIPRVIGKTIDVESGAHKNITFMPDLS